MSLPLAPAADKAAMQDLNGAWVSLAKQIRDKGMPAKTDFSIAACLARIVDVKTGEQLSITRRGTHLFGFLGQHVQSLPCVVDVTQMGLCNKNVIYPVAATKSSLLVLSLTASCLHCAGQQLADEQLGSQVAGTVTSAVDAIAQTCAWAL
jgi:hypothetical protein